jgi:HK97 gp10 family phage protein
MMPWRSYIGSAGIIWSGTWQRDMAGIKTTFKMEGLSELLEGLQELTKATATNVQKRVLKDAAVPFEQTAKAKAPRRTGHLAESIDISTKLSPRQKSDLQKESKIEIYVGPRSMARAIVQEFGSVNQSAQPYMRPAWDANKKSAIDGITKALADEIEKARQRAARKAAKQLAKMHAR